MLRRILMASMAMLMVWIGFRAFPRSSERPLESTTTPARTLSSARISTRYEAPKLAPTLTPTRPPTTTPPPTAAPTTAPTPTPRPVLPGVGPTMAGTLVAQAERFDLYVGINTLNPDDLLFILPRVEAGLDAAQAKLQSGFTARASVAVYQLSRRPQRGVRALAFSSERRIELYYASHEDYEGAVRVILHELGHQLESDRYGIKVQQNADVILHEGLATWLAGDEWLARSEAASWQDRARTLRDAGRLLPIRRDPGGAKANDAYEGWAAFVDYLIGEYGWPAFDDAYRSSAGRYPGSADYRLAYGKTLDELVTEWRDSLAE